MGPDPERLAHVLLVDAGDGAVAVDDAVVAGDDDGWGAVEFVVGRVRGVDADEGECALAQVFVEGLVVEPGDTGLDDVGAGCGAMGPCPPAVGGGDGEFGLCPGQAPTVVAVAVPVVGFGVQLAQSCADGGFGGGFEVTGLGEQLGKRLRWGDLDGPGAVAAEMLQ